MRHDPEIRKLEANVHTFWLVITKSGSFKQWHRRKQENFAFNLPRPVATSLKFLKFLYENQEQGCISFTVYRTVFSQCIKMHKLNCAYLLTYLALHCTLPLPAFSQDSVDSTLMFWLLMSDRCVPRAGLSDLVGKICTHDGRAAGWGLIIGCAGYPMGWTCLL